MKIDKNRSSKTNDTGCLYEKKKEGRILPLALYLRCKKEKEIEKKGIANQPHFCKNLFDPI